MSTAKQIFNEAFSKPRDPRSDALDRAIDAAIDAAEGEKNGA